jgi:hypothetical protein
MICSCGKNSGNYKMCFTCNKNTKKTICKCGILYNSHNNIYKYCYDCNIKHQKIKNEKIPARLSLGLCPLRLQNINTDVQHIDNINNDNQFISEDEIENLLKQLHRE